MSQDSPSEHQDSIGSDMAWIKELLTMQLTLELQVRDYLDALKDPDFGKRAVIVSAKRQEMRETIADLDRHRDQRPARRTPP